MFDDEDREDGQHFATSKHKYDLGYSNTSKQLEDFSYDDCYRPPIEPRVLLEIVEQSNSLMPLISIMATNLTRFGWEVKHKSSYNESACMDEIKANAEAEWQKLSELFAYFNLTESFESLMYKALVDYYSIGYCTIEIIRTADGEDIAGGEYARAANFRITGNNLDQYAYINTTRMINGDEKVIQAPKKFRKFIQMLPDGKRRYFKEFGDPRMMDFKTGEYVETSDVASEILFITSHNPANVYGNPIWIGCLADVLASRKASEVNLNYFHNGCIMDMALITRGGLLTKASMQALQGAKGTNNAHKIMVLEATAKSGGIATEDLPLPDIELVPLTQTNKQDATFQTLQQRTDEKLAAAFGLPPIYRGQSSDYNKATADVARILTEEQVFAPMRREIASHFNMVLEYEMGLKYCELRFKGPKMADYESLASVLQPFIEAGAVTPNMLVDTLGDILGKELEIFNDEWGNVPLEQLKINQPENSSITKSVDDIDELLSKLSEYM
ncbi:MAG: phage portal protein [Epulopiscium sp. Nele67-Bin004]|nr:MAG: phage portal protein [Epulopiscium sp. Nele67-Bin004]